MNTNGVEGLPGVIFGELPPTTREKRILDAIASIAQERRAAVLNYVNYDVRPDILDKSRYAIVVLNYMTAPTIHFRALALGKRVPTLDLIDARDTGRNLLLLRDLGINPIVYDNLGELRGGVGLFLEHTRKKTSKWEDDNGRDVNTISVGDLVIDPDDYRVTVAGEILKLTPHEHRLLHALARHAGRMTRYRDLLHFAGWADGDTSLLKTHISHVRRKIIAASGEGGPTVEIVSQPRIGYRLMLAASQRPIETSE